MGPDTEQEEGPARLGASAAQQRGGRAVQGLELGEASRVHLLTERLSMLGTALDAGE